VITDFTKFNGSIVGIAKLGQHSFFKEPPIVNIGQLIDDCARSEQH
jgi:hypothetical protein